jgi:hypothetical protein
MIRNMTTMDATALMTTGGAGTASTAAASAAAPSTGDHPAAAVSKRSRNFSTGGSALAFLAGDRLVGLGHRPQDVKLLPAVAALIFINWHVFFLRYTS